jgi:cellulose synthase/poly-beta-1,6-N-acetylglucosamine synthase-like glycosyltransferase/peptidoglycan/xylan/chitin deacetylase (PgdA/CDA1 family)
VLSFDDGPDPVWTPLLLDILKAEGAKAVFFVVGSRAAENPALIRRIVAEGHELGNHSYWHPDLSKSTEQRTLFELNANQRMLEGIAGISTVLFRPPYHSDSYPQSLAEFMTLVKAQELGYLTIAESVDSEDWNEPTSENVFERVKARRTEGNIILLHDGGGDRSATVAALPRIIHYLRNRGDQIVLLQTLLKLPREALMPPIPADDPANSRVVAQTGLNLVQKVEAFAWTFMIGATLLLLARTALVVILALRHRRLNQQRQNSPAVWQPVSVMIAAYNESKVIASTIRSILASDYPGLFELIVIDDGSTDDTLAIIKGMAAQHSRIRVLTQRNKGKAHALDRALAAASYETLVLLDADTQFQRDTIRFLVAPLAQPEVGAVCGHIRVGNLSSWIARFQSLEYICGFNLDRRAYDCWNAITVAPGATSAFKKSAIVKAGGIMADTLAEDTDLTFHLHRAGYQIRYTPQAVAYTEAPDTMRTLIRQRVRWAFGTLQCLWKHRDLVGSFNHPGLGWFSLPSVWFCQIFLVALVPVVDVMLILSLTWGAGGALASYAAFFFALEWAMALLGCSLEGEPLRTSLRIFPMRFVYRPLLCYAVWTSILRALRGAWYGWGKQDRRGTVNPLIETLQATTKKAA